MKISYLKKYALVLSAVLLIFFTASCASENHGMDGVNSESSKSESFDSGSYYESDSEYNMGYVKQPEITEDIIYDASSPAEITEESVGEIAEGRKIIYSSWYDISTEEYDKSISALDALCEKYGAYYESSESYGEKSEYSDRYARFIIRVPQENYKEFINETGNIGTVTHSGEDNKDVTEEYYDTEARLESAELREERLLEILAEASTLDDVLLLERELSDVRYEIENYTGTLKKYDSLINYSTVTVEIREVRKIVLPDSQRQTLGERMSASLNRGFDSFKEGVENFLVGVSYELPSLLFVKLPIIIIVAVVIVIIVNKKRKKRIRIIRRHKMGGEDEQIKEESDNKDIDDNGGKD